MPQAWEEYHEDLVQRRCCQNGIDEPDRAVQRGLGSARDEAKASSFAWGGAALRCVFLVCLTAV